MRVLSNIVIILVLICLANSLPIKKYYIEDYCRQQFVSLSPDLSNPIRLYLTRKENTIFEQNYCMLSLNTSEDFYLALEGRLGQLTLDKSKSTEKRLHFKFNTSITENVDIFDKYLVNRIIVIVDNNENRSQSNNKLLETELEFRAIFKHEIPDCDEFNESNSCLNTEEEMEGSSGEQLINNECIGNDCSGESFADCEDYETNCTTNVSQVSGSGYLQLNQCLFILCSLFWLRLQIE